MRRWQGWMVLGLAVIGVAACSPQVPAGFVTDTPSRPGTDLSASPTLAPTRETPTLTPTVGAGPCRAEVSEEAVAYEFPRFDSQIFATMPPGMPLLVEGRTMDGWLGFDPGIPQAANVGPFRLRWLPPGPSVHLEGECDALPVVEAPPAGYCFQMGMGDIPLYAEPDSGSDVVATLPAEGYAALVDRRDADWYLLDLGIGSEQRDLQGWMEGFYLNVGGDCGPPLFPSSLEGLALAPLPAGSPLVLQQVLMVGPSQGWAVGGVEGERNRLFATDDGGVTWREVTVPLGVLNFEAPETVSLHLILAEARQLRLALFPEGQGAGPAPYLFALSDNGGLSWRFWQPLDLEAGEGPPLVTFLSPLDAWLLHEGIAGAGQHFYYLYRTRDGGQSWRTLQAPPESLSPCHKTGLAFAEGGRGWMTQACPFEYPEGISVEVTEDGGVTWERLFLPPPPGLEAFPAEAAFCQTEQPTVGEGGRLFVVLRCFPVGDGQAQAFLYRTADSGGTWEADAYPGGSLLAVAGRLISLGREIYLSQDDGAAWLLVKEVNWDGQFSFVDAQRGWAVAREGEESALVFTEDGGRTWRLLEPVVAGP